MTLVNGQRLELSEGIDVKDLPPDLVIEGIDELETCVAEMMGTVENLVNSFSVNMSTSSIQNLQINQFVKNNSGLVKHWNIGPDAGKTESLETWAETSNL